MSSQSPVSRSGTILVPDQSQPWTAQRDAHGLSRGPSPTQESSCFCAGLLFKHSFPGHQTSPPLDRHLSKDTSHTSLEYAPIPKGQDVFSFSSASERLRGRAGGRIHMPPEEINEEACQRPHPTASHGWHCQGCLPSGLCWEHDPELGAWLLAQNLKD